MEKEADAMSSRKEQQADDSESLQGKSQISRGALEEQILATSEETSEETRGRVGASGNNDQAPQSSISRPSNVKAILRESLLRKSRGKSLNQLHPFTTSIATNHPSPQNSLPLPRMVHNRAKRFEKWKSSQVSR